MTVTLDLGSLRPADPAALRREAAGYLEMLLAALELEGPVEVVLAGADDPGVGEDGNVEKSADAGEGGDGSDEGAAGDGGGLLFTVGRPSDSSGPIATRGEDADVAIQLVERALYRGRERLVTAPVAARLWREVSGPSGETGADVAEAGSPGAAAPGAFVRTLRLAARSGVPPRRLCEALRDEPDPGHPRALAAALEDALAGREGPVLRLVLSPEQYDRCFDPGSGEALVVPDGDEQTLDDKLQLMHDGLHYELGLLFRTACERDASLTAPWFRVSLGGCPGPRVHGLEADEYLVNDTTSRLGMLDIPARAAVNPANGNEASLVEGTGEAERCRQAGLVTWGPEGYSVLCAAREVRDGGAAFVDRRLTRLYLVQLESAFPALVRAVRERFDDDLLTRVLRGLVEEGLSIRDLRTVLEGLLSVRGVSTADHGSHIVFDPPTGLRCPAPPGRELADLDADDYVECARVSLRSYISHKYTRGASSLLVYLLDPAIEARFQEPGPEPGAAERQRIIEAVRMEYASHPTWTGRPVVLTTITVRKPFRRLIEEPLPDLAVLSYQELSPEMNIQPLARISLD